MSNNQNLKASSLFFGANAVYIAEIYEKFLSNPSSVDASWQKYFADLHDSSNQVKADFGKGSWGKNKTKVVGAVNEEAEVKKESKKPVAEVANQNASHGAEELSIKAHQLIRAYRIRGHYLANLDPLNIYENKHEHELDIERHGFTQADLDKNIYLGGWLGLSQATLREIINILQQSYSGTLATEFWHIQALKNKEWLQEKIESSLGKPNLSKEEKKQVLHKLMEAVTFEDFLHKKFPGTKRFSSEGGDALLVALEEIAKTSSNLGVEEIVVGMPHRGRLNVLTAFMQKPYVAMLAEFQGKSANPDFINSSGDVKYHLGYSVDRNFGNKKVHMSLTPNPSHLEAVNPVVLGKVRAKQDLIQDKARLKALGILLHGDAAFCGQGVVAESLVLNDLDGYKTGGTVHIVVNNQVGFTTDPSSAHTSPYPTDMAMMIQAPIFHINGDDPEAVTHAARIASEYRNIFKKDVVLDIWCYRKWGHNEGDEPRFTQPLMYKIIDEKKNPFEIYAEKLVNEGVISKAEVEQMELSFREKLEKSFQDSANYKPLKADWLEGNWEGFIQPEKGEKPIVDTGVSKKTLKEIGKKLVQYPANFELHKGVQRVVEARKQMIESEKGLDWGTAESLAFGSLINEGFNIRFTGQDVIRGTFSHRHAGFTDQITGQKFIPLNSINKDAKIDIYNSNLSEFAVLGYEYGYSITDPNSLVLWEAQFGDFVNGAQVMIDQFIASAEVKWLRMSGLIMLLPHAYEGQGPEHSSARIERFLQLCAEDNMIVANFTTPANYFHALRKQLKRNFRKPLVVFSPKSLLRHKLAQSSFDDIASGTNFKRVIGEVSNDLVKEDKIKKLIITSGKVYYDLFEARALKNIKDVAIIRLEQYYPLPEAELLAEIKKYKNAEIIWCQEEPENMGAWNFLDRKLEKIIQKASVKAKTAIYAGRPPAAATACGYAKTHTKEQEKLINEALG
jgi:2-oxoglutarate dehydrogenase E1 component